MTAPLSPDLRYRLVRAVEGGASARQAAARFEVSPSAAIKLMQRVRKTGSTAPARIGGYRQPLLAGYEDVLLELTATRKGITLAEMRIAALLREAGWSVNVKRVERIWRREGLKVPKKQPKKSRLWLTDGSCVRLRPEHVNYVWSYDFVEHRTHEGRKYRMTDPIGVASDQSCPGIVAPDRARKHHAPDAVRVGCIVGRRNLLEDLRLDCLIRGRAIGLGQIECDLASCKRLEDNGCELGQAQSSFNKTNGKPEAAGDVFDGDPAFDQRGKGHGFVGRVHRQAVEVFSKAGLDRSFGRVFEDEAGHLMVAGKHLAIGERKHRPAAAFTGFDLKLALGSRPDDEILEQTQRGDAGLKLGIGCGIGMLANITG